MKFLIVDAFTETTFGGNPAGVVLLGTKAFPDDETMRKTAAELRYSETAFVKQLGPKEFQVRYFTPAAEVELCGHATIGTFCALEHLGIIQDGDVCLNHTLSGDLEINVSNGSVMMDMAEAKDLGTIDTPEALKELYEIMGADCDPMELDLKPQIITTGLPDIMMPLPTRDALNGMDPDMKALSDLSARYEVTGVHAFTLDAEEGATAHTRNFAPLYDIDEEAATGTSSGALTYYLFLNKFIGPQDACRFIQGEAMDRPSAILTQLDAVAEPCRIKVGGSAVVLAEGEIHLP
jgi:PhzF family phenazine biosynthesis protein